MNEVSGTEEKSWFVMQLDKHEMKISTLAPECVTNHRLCNKRQGLSEAMTFLFCFLDVFDDNQVFRQMRSKKWYLMAKDFECGVMRGGSVVARTRQARLSSKTVLIVDKLFEIFNPKVSMISKRTVWS